MKQRLEQILVTAWHKQSPWLLLLRPLSLLFGCIRKLRYFWLNHCRKKVQLKARVVIVGNISVGGSGKTSLTAYIAKTLENQGYSIAIISKGYARKSSLPNPVVVTQTRPTYYGDEPCLLSQQLKSPVIVCDDRLRALQKWQHKADVLICDDGLQDYRFVHDCEIALIDGSRGFGNGRLIPEGFLREPTKRLNQCDMVLQLSGNDLLPEAEGIFYYRAIGFRQLVTGKLLSIEQAHQTWQEQDIEAYAGLANNQSFFDSLQKLGFNCNNHYLADHHNYSSSDFAQTTSIKLMTAKDAVKCYQLADASYWCLEIDIQMDSTTARKLLSFVTG